MIEKLMKKKNFKILVYIFGALIEVIGFSLLFAFNKSIVLIHRIPIIFALIIIISGFLMSIGVRKR